MSSHRAAKHIMISYNWDNQPIVKRLATSLQDAGYNVWIDLEQMAGSILEASMHEVGSGRVSRFDKIWIVFFWFFLLIDAFIL